MRNRHVNLAKVAILLALGCGSTPEPTRFRDGPLAAARAGAPHPWEGAVPLAIGTTPFLRGNEGALNPATGGLALRFPLHEWHDRLPGAIVLAYDSQAEASARFRLDVDRVLVESTDHVVVEDAQLRPLQFARDGAELVAPAGVFAELVATQGGYDYRDYAEPDVIHRFAPSGGVCCTLSAIVDRYDNSITITRDAEDRIVGVTPANAPPIEIGWTDGVMTTMELATSTTSFGWTDGRLSTVAFGSIGGSLVFEYDTQGDPDRLARVTAPGGATLDITTQAGAVTRLELPGERMDVAYVSNTQVDLTRTPGTTTVMRYAAGGELVAVEEADGTLALGWSDRRLVSFTDMLGRATTMSLDPHGHVTSRDASGFAATYTWVDDRVTEISELGIAYTTEYNAQGRPIRETWNDGVSTHERTHAWTAVGLPASTTSLGATTAWVWDDEDRVLRVEYDGVTRQSFGYDPLGRIATITDGRGGTTSYEYANDEALVPASMTLPSGVTSTVSGDVPLETALTIQTPAGASVTSTTTYLGDGRVAGHALNGTNVVQYTY